MLNYSKIVELDLESLGEIANKKLSDVTVMELLTIIKGFVEQEDPSVDTEPKENIYEKKPTRITLSEFVEPIDRVSERTRIFHVLRNFLYSHEELKDEDKNLDLEAFARLLREKGVDSIYMRGLGAKGRSYLRQLFTERGINL